MQHRILTGIVIAMTLTALSACTTSEVDRSVAGYDQVKGQVKLGDSKSQVLAVLEPTQANLDPEWKRSTDTYYDGSSTVDVYYFRSGYDSDDLITSDQFTPYIFRDDILVGIGWAMLQAPSAQSQDESTAAAGNLIYNPRVGNPTTTAGYTSTPDYQDTFILYGLHSVSCQSWMQARRTSSDEAFQYEAWVTGFLSGAGWKNAPIAQTDYTAINYYVDDYCRRHPMKDLFAATKALINKLKVKRR